MFTLRNKVQLIGMLGNAPEITTIEAGKKRARFSIATNETYRNARGEKVKSPPWSSRATTMVSREIWVAGPGPCPRGGSARMGADSTRSARGFGQQKMGARPPARRPRPAAASHI